MQRRIVSRSPLLQARKYRVERLHTQAPSGPHDYDIIIHPGAAVILPVLDDGRIVLIRNERISVERELLELPAGTLDAGEQPQDCARRELTEETGYVAAEMEHLLSFYSSPGFCTELLHTFVARGLRPGPQNTEVGETIQLAPLPHDDVLAAIRDGRICDAKTIVSLLYYEQFQRA